MFWVISVYFNIRNTLPKFCPFLLGYPVCIYIYIYIYWNNGDVSVENNKIKTNTYKTIFQNNTTDSNNIYNVLNVSTYTLWETKLGSQWIRRYEHPRKVQHAKNRTHRDDTLHIHFLSSINNSEFQATSLHNPVALGFKLLNVERRFACSRNFQNI